MASNPINGEWYQEPESGDMFKVMAIGEGGDVDADYLGMGRRRLDRETWEAIDPVQVAPPEGTPTDTARSPSAPPPRH